MQRWRNGHCRRRTNEPLWTALALPPAKPDAADEAVPVALAVGSHLTLSSRLPNGLLSATGAAAVIQPGSIRDDSVIAAADEAGLALLATGSRHLPLGLLAVRRHTLWWLASHQHRKSADRGHTQIAALGREKIFPHCTNCSRRSIPIRRPINRAPMPTGRPGVRPAKRQAHALKRAAIGGQNSSAVKPSGRT